MVLAQPRVPFGRDAAQRLQQERRIGLSEAVNELARAGLSARPEQREFRQRTRPLGLAIDVSNVAEVLELIGDDERGT